MIIKWDPSPQESVCSIATWFKSGSTDHRLSKQGHGSEQTFDAKSLFFDSAQTHFSQYQKTGCWISSRRSELLLLDLSDRLDELRITDSAASLKSFGLEKRSRKRTRRGGGDVLDFPLSPAQIISVSELNKGGLTAAIATGLFLLHLLLLILTHTAALCPRGLNHLSSLHPPLSLSLSLLFCVFFFPFISWKQSVTCGRLEMDFNHR